MCKQMDISDIGRKVRILKNRMDQYCDYNRENDGMTHQQCRLIHYLLAHQEEDVFQKDIEEAFQVTGATASTMLKGMENKNLIQRVSMPQDKRLKKLVLTDKAIAFDEKVWKDILLLENSLQTGMTPEEVTTLCRLLDLATQNVDELNRKTIKSPKK